MIDHTQPPSTRAAFARRVEECFRRLERVDRPEVWIALRSPSEVVAEIAGIAERVEAGEVLPLAGLVFAVKDNIDVAGLPTTAAAASYRYLPDRDATSVARLRAAGAVVLGKTNLDQFATGLVGTRSPFGAVRNSWDPTRISGGSSSGSGVAVALGLVDFALGTDTAGSGRVPAALNGIIGVKPTKGLVPVTGVVPACGSLDVVTVFARELRLAERAVQVITGPDGVDARAREPQVSPLAGRRIRLGVPRPEQLGELAPGWAEAFGRAVAQFGSVGFTVTEVDIDPLLAAASMLYGTSFVAERFAAVGSHITKHSDLIGSDLDPTVSAIILAGQSHSAASLFNDLAELCRLGARGREALQGVDVLLTPTTTWHPTIDQVRAEPVLANSRMGRFTNFCNLLDMASLAIPAGFVDGLPFGVMLTGPAHSDPELAGVARAFLAPEVELMVVGAHLSGQPLNSQLVSAGGSWVADVATAATYRLYALNTSPPKPGLVRVTEGGASIVGEVWRLPADGFGRFVAALPAPMAIGTVDLNDGRSVSGFVVEPFAVQGAADITPFGGWRAYLGSRS